ncbi:MAG: histidinol-phosphatase [Acidimicrobiales bacterium]
MLDYHLHLWPHEESSVWFKLDQIADYCDEAASHGVDEVALTEHTSRFADVVSAVGPFWLKFGHEPTSPVLAQYLDWHGRNSLERYVELAQRAKDEGLPVKIGLEVDYYKDQMDIVSPILAQYPFDVLIGSVHWLGSWQFDDYEVPTHFHEWTVRDVDQCWADYTVAIEELAAANAVDVLAHVDLIKVAGFQASDRAPFWDLMASAAAGADLSVECSSAGWKKPVGEQYPSEGLIERLVAQGVTFTTASDAHSLERVGERADDLADLLESHGVTQLASYSARRRQLVPLRSS